MGNFETTSRGRHALTAMVDLTQMETDRPVPLSNIASKRRISLSYLEQMFAGLRKHGLVKSHRGPGGGYRLGMPAADISVAAIMIAAEDSPTVRRAKKNTEKSNQGSSQTNRMWQSMNGLIYSLLDHVSLDDVVQERLEVYEKLFKTKS